MWLRRQARGGAADMYGEQARSQELCRCARGTRGPSLIRIKAIDATAAGRYFSGYTSVTTLTYKWELMLRVRL